MKHWRIEDVAWDRFDPSAAEPQLVPLVKAAAMVERNGTDYAIYLNRVFGDDPDFRQAADYWAEEEVQHGDALGKWAMLADPSWDYASAFARYKAGYQIPLDANASIRGSRTGELIARCMVETGTSSYYTALAEATKEPVLQQVCRHIAADEYRHFKLFYDHMRRYLARENILVSQLSEQLRTRREELPERVAGIVGRLRDAERELERLKSAQLLGDAADLAGSAEDVHGAAYVAYRVEGAVTADGIRKVALDIRGRLAPDRAAVVAAIGVSDGRPTVVVAVNDAGRARGLRAGALVLAAAGALGGRGGGKDDVAQGGGAPLGDRADEAVAGAFSAARILISDIMGAGDVG